MWFCRAGAHSPGAFVTDLDTTGANLSRFGAVDQAGGRPARPREVRELPRALRALWAAAPVSLAGVVPGPGHSGFLLDGGVEGLGVVVSPLVEDGGVGVGGAEGEDGPVAHGNGSGGQLGGSLVVG